jgi:hypothetical protein
MSVAAEPEQPELCTRFSEGRRCPQGRNCPFIHKWALYNAARKERKLAKLNDNQRDTGNKFYAQRYGDMSSDMPRAGNIKSEDSRNGTLVPIQAAEKAHTSSASEKKHQQPVKDKQSSQPGKSRGKNWGKKISENVDHVQTANPMDNSSKSVKETETFRPDNPPPNMSFSKHADGQSTKGKFHFLPLHQKVNQSISRNMAALSINNQRANSRWSKVSKYGGSHDKTPSPRTAEENEDLNNCNGPARQVVEVRSARYVLKLCNYASQF